MQPVTDDTRAQHWRPIIGAGFHLEDSRHAQVVLALATLAAGDAIHQQVASPLRLVAATWPLWAMLLVTAAAALLSARWWLLNHAVPAREAFALGAVFALALSVSNYHTAHWLEVATDTDGPQEILYLRDAQAGVVFLPVDGAAPRLSFRRDKDYWDNLRFSQPYGFTFSRGWSGSWVLDESPVQADIALHRNFFKEVQRP